MDKRSQENPQAGPRYRIVAVDSSEAIPKVLRRVLELKGHEVQTARTGQSGLDLVAKWQPDVVFSAIELCELNGFELARAIRASEAPQPLLIACTGHLMSSIRTEAVAAGFDLYLPKPFAIADVITAVEVRGGGAPLESMEW